MYMLRSICETANLVNWAMVCIKFSLSNLVNNTKSPWLDGTAAAKLQYRLDGTVTYDRVVLLYQYRPSFTESTRGTHVDIPNKVL